MRSCNKKAKREVEVVGENTPTFTLQENVHGVTVVFQLCKVTEQVTPTGGYSLGALILSMSSFEWLHTPFHLSEGLTFRAVRSLFASWVSDLHPYLLSSRVMGISCSIIKPKDVVKLHPFLNIHDLVGALHLPEDAVVSPPDVNHALAVAAAGRGTVVQTRLRQQAARVTLFNLSSVLLLTLGVQILERTSVQQVLVEKGQVTAVETDRGSIECEYFVNCAGQVNLRQGSNRLT